jgi:hypothetical protein
MKPTAIYRVSFMWVYGVDEDREINSWNADDDRRVRAADAEDAIRRTRAAVLEDYNSGRGKGEGPKLKDILVRGVDYITGVDL